MEALAYVQQQQQCNWNATSDDDDEEVCLDLNNKTTIRSNEPFASTMASLACSRLELEFFKTSSISLLAKSWHKNLFELHRSMMRLWKCFGKTFLILHFH
jgi:hypothetical protein